jgi:hypothetical protein
MISDDPVEVTLRLLLDCCRERLKGRSPAYMRMLDDLAEQTDAFPFN